MLNAIPRDWFRFFEEKVNTAVERWLPDNYNPQRARDKKVIRDALWGFNLYYPHEISIIDSSLFQRLRGIAQTSLAQYTYPSATHTRFQHSLGAVTLAEKVLKSLNEKMVERGHERIEATSRLETRLAALLHDVGHGPFSHGTEEYFKRHPAFDALRKQIPELFKDSVASEILSYFVVKSRAFQRFWQKVVDLYPKKRLHHISLDNVARLIIGHPLSPQDHYLTQIINGPFDVDKLDYLSRDGYYTGLRLHIDVDRLLLAVDLGKPHGESSELVIDFGGVSALEQLLFSKMVIFTSVYHHHKVRSSLYSLFKILDTIMEGPAGILGACLADPEFIDETTGKPYPNPFSFLLLDDHDLLGGYSVPETASEAERQYLNRLNKLILDLKGRRFLKRAIVLSMGVLSDEDGSQSLFSLLLEPARRQHVEDIRRDIALRSEQPINDIVIDIPSPPRFDAISSEAYIKMSEERCVELESVFPTSGWVTGYAQYKNKVYILCPEKVKGRVGQCAVNVLKEYGITVKPEALEQAKQSFNIIRSTFPVF